MATTLSEMRSTRQRAQIAQLIDSLDEFQSAQQIHALLLKQRKKVGLATVYRTLAALAESGQVDAITLNNELLYRRCSPEHHHHIRCRICGSTVEVSADVVERWASEVAKEHGFSEISHSIEISGTCRDCR